MKKKTIIIAGAGGMIGSSAVEYFKEHEIMKIGRNDFLKEDEDFIKDYETADIIINFSGATIAKRWSAEYKREILDSRINTTRKLGLIITDGIEKPRHYLSASATGIYSEQGCHTEESRDFGKGFIKEVVQKWENEALTLSTGSCSISLMRIGVVLSKKGGMLKRLLPIFKLGLGGRIGNGKQAFSWIHLDDLLRSLDHIITNKQEGIYNLVSPGSTTNDEFTKILAKSVNRFAIVPVPVLALRMLFGKVATVISGGQMVYPERLLKEKFSFQFPDMEQALRDIVN